MSVKAVMAQTFPPGVANRNTGVSRHEIQVFLTGRRDNHTLGVTLGWYINITGRLGGKGSKGAC